MKKIHLFVLAIIAVFMFDGCQEVTSPLNTVPTVTTDAVVKFSGEYAYLSGKTSSKGEFYFLVSTSEDMTDARTIEAFPYKRDQDTEWLCDTEVGDLQPGVTYYVVLCATDGRSEVRGNTVSFTTSSYLKIESAFTDDGQPYEGDVLGIYLTDTENRIFEKKGNMRALGKNRTGYDLPYQFVVTEPTKVYAYIPYNEDNSDNSLYVNVDNSQGYWDYQYGSCLVSKENPKANIEMQSAMSKLLFQIYVDEGVSSIGLLTLHLDDVAGNVTDKVSGSGSLNLATGEIVGDPGDGVDFAVKQWVDGGAYVTVEGYVIPTSFEDGEVEVSLNWINDGGDGFLEFPIPAAKWEKGRIYEIPLTVNIEEKQEESEIVGEAIYMGFNGDNGKPLYWSSWNLGASSPEDYGGLYGWADPTGVKRSTNLNDYPNANPPKNIAGTEYDIAREMWGVGWRIPSVNEMWSLLANSNEEWTSIDGVKGVKYTSKINGNSLFFPVAPIRYGNSVDSESETYYWLCNLDGENPELGNTFYIFYRNDHLNDYPTAGKQRYFGLPIRPVKEMVYVM